MEMRGNCWPLVNPGVEGGGGWMAGLEGVNGVWADRAGGWLDGWVGRVGGVRRLEWQKVSRHNLLIPGREQYDS